MRFSYKNIIASVVALLFIGVGFGVAVFTPTTAQAQTSIYTADQLTRIRALTPAISDACIASAASCSDGTSSSESQRILGITGFTPAKLKQFADVGVSPGCVQNNAQCTTAENERRIAVTTGNYAQAYNNFLTNGGTTNPSLSPTQQANVANASQAATTNDVNRDKPSETIQCKGITGCITVLVYAIGPGLASKAAYVGAYVFSIAIKLSLNSTAYALNFLTEGWTTVRDIANMSFIFLLIYLAITIMLNAETQDTLKRLALIVVIALVINFSFFFTRVVIDSGNILALQFYNAIPNNGVIGGTSNTGAALTSANSQVKDLSLSIMGAVNVQSLLSNQAFSNATKASGNDEWSAMATFVFIYIGMAILLWVLFFAFIHIGIMFILRIIGLWLLLIVSPLAFVAKTMSKTEKYFSQWLQKLIAFSTYPAVFLFLFWILTKFSRDLFTVGTSGGNDFFSGALNVAIASASNNEGIAAALASITIRMVFVIGFLYAILKITDMAAAQGGSLAVKANSKFSGLAMGRRFGNFAGRSYLRGQQGAYNIAVARPASSIAERIPTSRIGNTRLGYRLTGGIKELTKVKVGGTSLDEAKHTQHTEAKKRDNYYRDVKAANTSNEVISIMEANKAADTNRLASLSDQQLKHIQSLNKRELEALGEEKLLVLAPAFTDDQIKTIMKDLDMPDSEKEHIRHDWDEHSPESAYAKSSRAVANLVAKNTALGTSHQIALISTQMNAGAKIDKAKLAAAKNEIENLVTRVETDVKQAESDLDTIRTSLIAAGHTTGTGASTDYDQQATYQSTKSTYVAHKSRLGAVKEMQTLAKNADEHREKVAANIGDETNKGEYKRKP